MLLDSDASLNYFDCLLLKEAILLNRLIHLLVISATGMCLAREAHQRVVVFSGDGGFQMTPQCLSTQTRFGLNPIIFVIDNGVYSVEQWLYDTDVFSSSKTFFDSCILHRWQYSKLADVFGCKGWEVSNYEELDSAILAALENANTPSIIQVKVPQKSLPDNAKWKEK